MGLVTAPCESEKVTGRWSESKSAWVAKSLQMWAWSVKTKSIVDGFLAEEKQVGPLGERTE